MSGVHQGFISKLEADRGTPGRELIFNLARVLRVSPDYLETGAPGPETQLRRAIGTIWTQLVYVLANQIIVPRRESAAPLPTADPALQTAVAKAWDVRTYCEFCAWAAAGEGRAIGETLAQSRAIEALATALLDRQPPSFSAWIEYADPQQQPIRMTPRFGPGESHVHDFNVNTTEAAVDHQPGTCFRFDLEAGWMLYSLLRLGLFHGVPSDYARLPFQTAFVRAATPAIFWSAARAWSDRRLVGWFAYLGLPMDLFAPLARLARQYDAPDSFRAAADRLLKQADPADCDAFLGLFVDIPAEPHRYFERFGERPSSGGPEVTDGPDIPVGTWPVRLRRRNRELTVPRLYLEAIHMLGDARDKAEVVEWLKQRAPRHEWTTEDVLRLAPPAGRKPRAPGPLVRFEPPETLP